MKVTLRADVKADDYRTPLDPRDLLRFLQGLPDPDQVEDFTLTPLMGDRGSQREPEPYMRGMLATWAEDR